MARDSIIFFLSCVNFTHDVCQVAICLKTYHIRHWCMLSHVMLSKTHKKTLLSRFCLFACSPHQLAPFYLTAALSMTRHVGIFIFVCAEVAAMLVLVMCFERDDAVHWALLHKTKWYFKTFMTNHDFPYVQNYILNWLTSYNWNGLKTFFFFTLFIEYIYLSLQLPTFPK